MAKSSINWTPIIIFGMFLLALNAGYFNNIFSFSFGGLSRDIIIKLESGQQPNPTTGEPCTLTINPAWMWTGGTMTGTIIDGKNQDCTVYGRSLTDDWRIVYEGTTDANGLLRDTAVIDEPNTYTFAGICGECVTNYDEIEVESPDSDGDGFTDWEEGEAGTNPHDASDFPGADWWEADDDGDGFSNGDEASAGTDPYDPSDHPSTTTTTLPTTTTTLPTMQYTCGLYGLDSMCGGTCPTDYTCNEVSFASGPEPEDQYYACACLSGTAVHPLWKPDGPYHFPMELD